MSKFKVGDQVVGNKKANRYGITKEGWKGTVTAVNTYQIRVYGFGSVDEEGFWVDPDCFDLVVSTPNILIFTRKNRVVATITKGVQKFTQSVSLSKAGDFKTAVKMVVEKLLDRFEAGEQAPLTATSIDWESFKAGKFAVHCDTEEKAKAFLKECDEQGMKWNAGRNPNAYTNWNYYKEKTLYSTHGSSNSLCYHDINGVFQQSANLPIIDYTPSKPAVKETKSYRIVKQDKYEVGDKVKIIDKWVDGCHENPEGEMDKWLGKIMTIREVSFNDYKMEEDKTENCGTGWYWNNKCIEGKVVEDVPEKTAVKEVKRPAKVGEWIKIVNADHMERYRGCEEYKNGDILKVAKTNACCLDDVLAEGISEWIDKREYVVLENYQPEQSSLESKANYTTEIQIGDTVKVVNNGKCYTRYEEWFVKNAPQYLGKFAYGGMPKNGGSYKVLMKNDKDGLKYVIQEIDWPNDAVYLIDEKGIEKVK